MSARSRLIIPDRTVDRGRGRPPLCLACDLALRYSGNVVPALAANDSLASHMLELRARQAVKHHPRSRNRQRGFILNPYAFGTSGDPYFANVVWLLDMDGANNGTVFTDLSSYARAFTAQSTGKTVTATVKFGTASLQCGGGYIDTPDSSDFTLGSGDWCIEGWFYQPSTWGSSQWLMGQAPSNGATADTAFGIKGNGASPVKLFATIGTGPATTADITGTTTLALTTWYYFAYCRSGNTAHLLLDSGEEGTVSVTGVTVNNSAYKLAIGQLGERTVGPFSGNIDECRMTVGQGRYTGAITAPTAIFPRS